LPPGHLLLRKPWLEQALNRHRVRWKPLRKGWAKYRLRRLMLSGKPWRVRVQPMAMVTRPHASKHWPRCGALLVSSLRTTLMASADCAADAARPRRRGDRVNRCNPSAVHESGFATARQFAARHHARKSGSGRDLKMPNPKDDPKSPEWRPYIFARD